MSLVNCLSKLKISPAAAKELKAESLRYMKDGMDRKAAELQAVKDMLGETNSSLDSIREKLGEKAQPIEIKPEQTLFQDKKYIKPLTDIKTELQTEKNIPQNPKVVSINTDYSQLDSMKLHDAALNELRKLQGAERSGQQKATIHNDHTGWDVTISRPGVKEFDTKGKKRLDSIVAINLESILKNAVWLRSENDRVDLSAPKKHYLYAPIDTKEGSGVAKIVLVEEQFKKGTKKKVYFLDSAVFDGSSTAWSPDINQAKPGYQATPTDPIITKLYDAINNRRETDPLFQNDNKPMGSVTFGDEHPIVTLFKSANYSTFMHESAHIWFKDMHDFVQIGSANEKYLADYKTLADHLGIKEGQTELTREQQETFARSFEAYLMEGKSPSKELTSVFASFKRWLTKIYKNVAGLDVKLSDPVRRVMDRMVAAEDEINAAERSVGVDKTIDDPSLPKEAVKTLKDMREQAHEEAIHALLKQQMDELSKENQDKIAKGRAGLEEKAKAQVEEMPVYKAQSELEESIKRDPKEIAKDYIEGKLSEEEQAHFQVIAETNDYTSGDHLAKEILGAKEKEKVIAEHVDAWMTQFDDLKDTSAIKDVALEKIHSEKTAEIMALEKGILEGMVSKLPENEANKKRRMMQAKVDWEQAKQLAENHLATKPVKEATRFVPYFTAERNEAMAVARAIEKKDYAKAAEHKNRQLLNHALALESMRLKKVVEKWTTELDKTQSKRKDLFKEEAHFNQVAAILERMGLPRQDFVKDSKFETLAAYAERMNEAIGTVSIPDWIMDESKTYSLNNLTVDELQDVVNSVRNIQKAANAEKNAFKVGNKERIDDIALRLSEELSKRTPESDKRKHKAEVTGLDTIKRMGRLYNESLMKAATTMLKADGYKDNGSFHKIFIEPVHEAASEEFKNTHKYVEKMKELYGIYNKAEMHDLFNKEIYIEELGASAAKQRILAMALNLGNEGNRERLFSTAPVWAAPGIEWNEKVVHQILEKHMTAKDWHLVQGMWDMINGLWPDIAEMHSRLTGFTPGKIQPLPFIAKTKEGNEIAMKGGYYPLKQDYRGSERANLQEQLDQPLYAEKNPGWLAVTKTGHTKERAKSAEYAVSLDLSVANRHMKDVIHDLAFRELIADHRRLMANEDLVNSMRTNLGDEAFQNISNWVKSVATGNNKEKAILDPLEKMAQALRHRTTFAVLGLRLANLTENLSNTFLYGGAVEGFGGMDAAKAFLFRGIGDYMPKSLVNSEGAKATREFIFEKSPFMAAKHETVDFSMADVRDSITGEKGHLRAFAEGLMVGSDELNSIPMWMEAYHKKLAETSNEKEAVKYADTLIERVNGSAWKYDQAPIQRGSETAKLLSMFYSFINTEYNRWSMEVGKAKVENTIKAKGKFFGFVASRLLLWQVASTFFAGKQPGKDEDPAAWWASQVLKYPTSFFPGFRELAGLAIDGLLGMHTYGFRPSPATAVIDAATRVGAVAKSAVKGRADGQEVAEAAAKIAALSFPYPDQINSWFFNALDLANGKIKQPEIGDLYRRRPKKER